ncbi:porin [Xanthobacter agilis]|uniref:Porin n=1 Tax=Xanthobacter agilis TaxID=47492 RepID=A0ABU0L901_XANAG|nr:porin [Xanthobacter agilis]MDQ0503606.1 hypothetical protein [Xanthobacter agilis]
MTKIYTGFVLAGVALVHGLGPAIAADLVKAEKAEQYVKVCSAFGEGYFYIPGTDTCLKLGGYLRSDTYVNAVGTFNPPISNVSGKAFNAPGAGVAGFPLVTADSSDYDTRTRGLLAVETRTQTDYGMVRTLFRFGEQWDSQAQPGVSAGASLYFERAFIQFAGFTAGYANSFFNAGTGITYIMATPYAGDNMWNTVLAYTAEFGNGISASLSLEDAANRSTGVQAGAASSAYTEAGALIPTATGMSYVDYQAGLQLPDLVGNVRLDQTWGTLMLSGALHRVGALSPMAAPFTSYVGGSADNMLGWAVGAITEFKLPMLAPGDRLYLQANYADGALNYLGLSGTPQVHASGLGAIQVGSTLLSSSGAYYPIADAVWNNDTLSYSTETGWAISAQYKHYWMPTLRSGLYLGYVAVNVPENTVGAFDVNVAQAVANLVWTPARNLDIGVEVIYSRVDGEVPLANRAATTATGAATYATTGGSTDVWSGGMRVQRNF